MAYRTVSIPLLLLFAISLWNSPVLASSQCYCMDTGDVNTCGVAQRPCGGNDGSSFQTCCAAEDTCLKDSFCQFRVTLQGASGYYLGGCTDKTFKDPVCNLKCSKLLKGYTTST